MLPMLFWAETAATENKNHRTWLLEFRAFGASRRGRKAHSLGVQRLEQCYLSFACFLMCDQSDQSGQKRRIASIANMN
jgi:hypothetical protein